MIDRVQMGGADVTSNGFDVGQDAFVEVVVRLQTRVSGRVRFRSGQPMPEVWVVLFSETPERWDTTDSRSVRLVRTGATGEFHVLGLPPGRYHAAVHGGMLAEPGQSTAPEIADLPTLLPGSTTFEIAERETSLTVVVD